MWARYADNLLTVAAVFDEFTAAAAIGGLGLILLVFSLLNSRQISIATRGLALGDLSVAAIAALLGLWRRWKGQ
ncbi:MAG: hypothetical protein DLM67_07730 [Candidatus Nephthysia bennettiae]|nr:MAG: hypothetical protein DLM67_07730 [Candidatus Dormibacteraeota bacterium]